MADRGNQVKASSDDDEDVTTVSATELADRLGDVLDRAFAGKVFRVTTYNRERAFVLGPEQMADYRRLQQLERRARQRRTASGAPVVKSA